MPVEVRDWYDIRVNGNDSTYDRCLTHRYVSDELRFMTVALNGTLREFTLPASEGTQTSTTNIWNIALTGSLGTVLGTHVGIWYEQAESRLWVVKSPDYTPNPSPATISILTLGETAAVVKQFSLDVPAKRVYGGVRKVPDALVADMGSPYVCGWGGYTSLLVQGGGAALGPSMFGFPDPDEIEDGSTGVETVTILDPGFASAGRGIRASWPVNYFDGGDPRSNPSTRPDFPPLETASWLSPNLQGYGWWVWGDSYYNTGNFIGNRWVAVASLAGVPGATETVVGDTTLEGYTGAGWYAGSTLRFDGRQFEVHAWDSPGSIADPLTRPDHLEALPLTKGNAHTLGNTGNGPVQNVAGATYDETTDTLWCYLPGFGANINTGRLFDTSVTFATSGETAMAFTFNAGTQGLLDGSIDWANDTIRCRLVETTEEIDEDATAMTDIGVTGNDQTLQSKVGPTKDDTNDRTTYGAANPVFGSQAAGPQVNRLVIFKFDTEDAGSTPIALLDITPTVPADNDITVQFTGGLAFVLNNQPAA